MSIEPRATYRVQLQATFGFQEAAAIAGYLAELGISHLYSSPLLQAEAGSTHGYDVVDPTRVSDELGGPEGHQQLISALQQHGLGLLLDIVPNHMAIGSPRNRWWWEVLENGPASLYASYFDVDWDPPEARIRNLVLLPILGDHYGRVLEAGELTLERDRGRFQVRYYDHVLPVSPRSLGPLLSTAADRCGSAQLAFLADAFAMLPSATETDQRSVQRRHRDKEILREQLAQLCHAQGAVAAAVDAVVAETNADPDALDRLLERQNYRLALWRAAGHDLDYRRFFDINTLVALRTEDEQVFAATHARVLEWLRAGRLDGLRIDHIDGLRDPAGYLRRLKQAAPNAWTVVEKILEPGERLPAGWPVAGTTGYDFLNRVGGLFVDRAGERGLNQLYREFTGHNPDGYDELVREKKHQVMREVLGSDINRLTEQLLRVCEQHRRYRDYTRHDLHEALRELIACFPVYRTYVQAETGEVSRQDVACINRAAQQALLHRPDIDPALFQFLADILLLRISGPLEADFVMRFQQVTGPVMAKGVEDTAFYCYHRLVSLNEVGGDPGRFGMSVAAFHRACTEAQGRWGQALLATSTHDTKRSGDVRARISLLSEIPVEWAKAVRRWSTLTEKYRAGDLPDRNTEYLFYQTAVGAWPLDIERARAYMLKAAREAKVHTSWTAPQQSYEDALHRLVEGALTDRAFCRALEEFVTPLIAPGRINSLSQTLIKATAPGVPDFYQGTELWDLSLVDPDNRRPVDYALRRRLLAELDDLNVEAVLARSDEGLPKLWVIRQALRFRARRPELFAPGSSYRPMAAAGRRRDHVIAFARGEAAITVAPRLVLRLNNRWEDTALDLPAGPWHDQLSGQTWPGGPQPMARLLSRFPVALLTRD